MKTLRTALLILYSTVQVVYCLKELVNDQYESHPNKRLRKDVIKTVMTSSRFKCMTLCSRTDGCLAVNVIDNSDITCELTTGFSSEDEMQDARDSEVLVMGFNKCADLCLNGATCEQIGTSTRCHCTDRFQGDKCDQCSERFQGDGCQECVDGYYGDDCDVSFTSTSGKRCSEPERLHEFYPTDPEYTDCKEWCVNNNDCGGFAVGDGRCEFKTCKN